MPVRDYRAWRVHRLGTPAEALRLDTVAPRPPGSDEAWVSIGAVGLNFPDMLVCAGRYQERPALPFAPGFEAAGTVVEAGPEATVRPGQKVVVVPELPNGSFQEMITVRSSQLYPVPDAMPVSVAAVLHIAYQTAHVALHRRGGLQSGETLVVTGAAGGVGMAAVQLGVAAGARVVAVVTGAAKAAACRGWGAERVIDLGELGSGNPRHGDPDGPGEDLGGQLDEATAARGADVIVDVVGGKDFDYLRRHLAFEGRLVVVGFTGGAIGAVPANHALLRNYSVVGMHLAPYRRHNPAVLQAVHSELVTLWEQGRIAPSIHRLVPFEDAVEALGMLERREAIGRVVLTTGN